MLVARLGRPPLGGVWLGRVLCAGCVDSDVMYELGRGARHVPQPGELLNSLGDINYHLKLKRSLGQGVFVDI